MGLELIPRDVRDRYHVEERWHACAVLSVDCGGELTDILDCLRQFILLRSEVEEGGGRKTKITARVDRFLEARGWEVRSIKVARTVGELTTEAETHKVDFCKSRVAIEMEWNSKDSVFSRDLNSFRLLHELDVISAAVILTRMDDLQELFNSLGVGKKYGASTTHWSKLIPKLKAGGAGTCPLLLVGITRECYKDDLAPG
ncbi:MAG: BglII/BstYI family type II restriction endonuclease [Terriglobia bacterium]|jgi:hypothetical protein